MKTRIKLAHRWLWHIWCCLALSSQTTKLSSFEAHWLDQGIRSNWGKWVQITKYTYVCHSFQDDWNGFVSMHVSILNVSTNSDCCQRCRFDSNLIFLHFTTNWRYWFYYILLLLFIFGWAVFLCVYFFRLLIGIDDTNRKQLHLFQYFSIFSP